MFFAGYLFADFSRGGKNEIQYLSVQRADLNKRFPPNHPLDSIDSIGRERLGRVKSGYLFRPLHDSFIAFGVSGIGYVKTHVIFDYPKCMKRCVEHNEIGSKRGKRVKGQDKQGN